MDLDRAREEPVSDLQLVRRVSVPVGYVRSAERAYRLALGEHTRGQVVSGALFGHCSCC